MINWIGRFFEGLCEHIGAILLTIVLVAFFIAVVVFAREYSKEKDDNKSYGISENRTYAIVMDNAGNIKKEGKIKRWCRMLKQDTIDIEFEDGSIYTTSAVNVILICKEE